MPLPIAYAALAGFQVISAFQQAETMRGQAALNRKIATLNSDQALLDAFNAEKDGYTMEARYQQTIDKVLSDQQVRYAVANVDTGYGSASDVVGDTKRTAFLNKIDIRNQAHQKAMGYKNQSAKILLQGEMNQQASNIQAGSVQNAGLINAASTMLSGYEKLGAGEKPKPGGNNTISPSNGGRNGANFITDDI